MLMVIIELDEEMRTHKRAYKQYCRSFSVFGDDTQWMCTSLRSLTHQPQQLSDDGTEKECRTIELGDVREHGNNRRFASWRGSSLQTSTEEWAKLRNMQTKGGWAISPMGYLTNHNCFPMTEQKTITSLWARGHLWTMKQSEVRLLKRFISASFDEKRTTSRKIQKRKDLGTLRRCK